MDGQGNIRKVTDSAPIRSDEVPLTEAEAADAKGMTRAERRRLFREKAKGHRQQLHPDNPGASTKRETRA